MTHDVDQPGKAVASAGWPQPLVRTLVADFARMRQAWQALDVALLTPAAPGSACAVECTDQHAAYAHDLAATSLRAALDHLVTWEVIAGRTPFRPTFAHFSLIRAAHESSWLAYWLLEPGTDATDRLVRGMAAQYVDYDERKKIEDAMGQLTVRPPAKSAADRLNDLLAEASLRGLTQVNKRGKVLLAKPMPSAVELFDLYEPAGQGVRGSYLYRLLSGYAHGKQWAVTQGVQAAGALDANGRTLGQVQANPLWAVAATQRVINAFEKAVDALLVIRRSAP